MNDSPDADLDRAALALQGAKRVAVLTGAGVSAESGVPTFRGNGGLWEGHRVEEVATPEAFARDPALVWRFYNARRAGLRSVAPNPGHFALVALEQRLGDGFTLITQNVDGLHRKAGSVNVLELHGNLRVVRCTVCGTERNRGLEELPELPKCDDCGELLRPAIVWFHEVLPVDVLDAAKVAATRAHVFLVVGTSAAVWPAAGLVPAARAGGATVIEVNPAASEMSHLADVVLQGPSGVLLPRLVERLEGAA